MTFNWKKSLRAISFFKQIFAIAVIFTAILLAGCKTTAKTEADCGPLPSDAQAQIDKFFRAELGNPDAMEFQYEPVGMGRFRKSGSSDWGYAWRIKVWVRGRTVGGYTKPQPYWFFFSKGRLVYKIRPDDVPEDDWRS